MTVATIIGRGHSGTRAGTAWLQAAGFDLGPVNGSLDRMPGDPIYQAARLAMSHLPHLGGTRWDIEHLNTCPIPGEWKALWNDYLAGVLAGGSRSAWKLPETVLSYPWLVRTYPQIRYLVMHRDPRDTILKHHGTDCLASWGVKGWPDNLDTMQERALSWVLQYQLIEGATVPPYRLRMRLQDFVSHQHLLAPRVARLLDLQSMPAISTVPEAIGRWRQHSNRQRLDCTVPILDGYVHHFAKEPFHW